MDIGDIRVLVVIPVYNHAPTIRSVAEGVLAQHADLLVVDDGSSDDPESRLEGLDIEYIRQPENCGKGAAIRTAAEIAAARGMTHIITLDADGQHDPAEIPKFLAAIRENPYALVIGRRDFSVLNVPFASKFGRAFGNFWVRIQTGQPAGDIQSGYRAYPVCVLRQIKFWTSRYAFEVEVVVRAAWAGILLRSIEISVHYDAAEDRVSHFDKLRDNLVISLLNTHLTFRSMLPWPYKKIQRPGIQARKITVLHPLRSMNQLLTENVTPTQLACASAVGVFLGAVPLFGLHTLAIIFAAGWLGLNKPMAVASSHVCLPPLVPALCIEAGYFMRNDGQFLTEVSLRTLGYQAPQRLLEWLLGSLVVGPVVAVLVGLVTYVLAVGVRQAGAESSPKQG